MFCSLDFEYLKKEEENDETKKKIGEEEGEEKEGKKFYKWYLAYISSLNFKFKMKNLIIEAIYRWKYLKWKKKTKQKNKFFIKLYKFLKN